MPVHMALAVLVLEPGYLFLAVSSSATTPFIKRRNISGHVLAADVYSFALCIILLCFAMSLFLNLIQAFLIIR